MTKKFNIEYHKLGEVIQLSGDKNIEQETKDFECSICNKKIKNIPKNRVKVIVGKTSYIPETWGICSSCRRWKRKPIGGENGQFSVSK